MAALIQRFRLEPASETGGLSCDANGVRLAGVDLLLNGGTAGFMPRPPSEVAAIVLAAYGASGDDQGLQRGLAVAAKALSEGDLCKAMIAAVHLRLPEIGEEGARRVAAVEEFLAKFDPSEPRDWHGRIATKRSPMAQSVRSRPRTPFEKL